MDTALIKQNMLVLQEKLGYIFNDINLLSEAMNACKIYVPNAGKNHKEYVNGALATVGDAVLKLVLADYLYMDKGIKIKGEITREKEQLENNEVLYALCNDKKIDIIKYAYNEKFFYRSDSPSNEKVANPEDHSPYIEAIIGAIYYDSDYECTKEWIIKKLKPELERCSKFNQI